MGQSIPDMKTDTVKVAWGKLPLAEQIATATASLPWDDDTRKRYAHAVASQRGRAMGAARRLAYAVKEQADVPAAVLASEEFAVLRGWRSLESAHLALMAAQARAQAWADSLPAA